MVQKNEFSINDGLFELVLIKKPKNKLGLLKIFVSILRNKYDQKTIYYMKTKHLQIDFEENVEWTLDGEYGGAEKHILIQNNRKRIGLLIPKKGGK